MTVYWSVISDLCSVLSCPNGEVIFPELLILYWSATWCRDYQTYIGSKKEASFVVQFKLREATKNTLKREQRTPFRLLLL